jgi:hypothetical protein
MALAILDLLDFDEKGLRFSVDTGTNRDYEIKFGRSLSEKAGIQFVEEIFYITPLRRNPSGGDLLSSACEFLVESGRLGEKGYAQLFTYKDGRRAATFSDPVELPPLALVEPRRPIRTQLRPSYAQTISQSRLEPAMSLAVPTKIRTIAHRDLARPASLTVEALLGEVLKIAQPVVASLLQAPGGPAGQPAGGNPTADIVAQLLRTVLGAIGAPAAQPQVAQTKSLAANRFKIGRRTYAQQMIFGIDDVLIASMVGPLLNVLPQLMNAANQEKQKRRDSQNAFVGNIINDVNRRLMMDKVLEAQRQTAGGPSSGAAEFSPEALVQLLALLGQAVPAGAAPALGAAAPLPPAVAAPQSLTASARKPEPSAKAVLMPLFGDKVAWHGGQAVLFSRDRRIALRFRFIVAEPIPTKPLEMALFKVLIGCPTNPALKHEKTLKLTAVSPNTELECVFDAGELAHLPIGCMLSVTGELCWTGRSGTAKAALGSAEFILVGSHFIREQGRAVGPERELVDMSRFRHFWNKVWEAPNLDNARGGGDGKRRWKLDINARYTVVLGLDERNGVMEPKQLAGTDAPQSAYELTTGRLKAGIEIGMPQLNALRSLWDLKEPLSPEIMAALGARSFLDGTGGETILPLEMTGRAGERGMVWMIPTFRLFDIPLSKVEETASSGQVTKVSDLSVQFPLPTGVRALGLKTSN